MMMTFGPQTFGLLVTLYTARVCARNDAYMPPEMSLASSLGSHEDDRNRISAFNLFPEESKTELLSLSNTLEMLENGGNPYCSDRVSTLLQRCTKDALTTEDRDEAAMLLTLCDRARDYPPPMECETFGTDADGADKVSVRRCIIALDQHQNFQRAFDVYRILVIPEKCKTLNGIFNVDPSRETYRNMTRDLIGFLQFFARKESETENHLAQWDDRLNALQNIYSDLNTVKYSLVEYGDNFADYLNRILQTLNATFEDIAIATQKTNEETSLKLRGQISQIAEEHAATLASAVIHLEQSLSTELDVVFNAAQERQNHLDLAAALSIEQLMGAVNDLSVARQEFEILGIFVKEATAKAYSQAMLLDNKHYELSESISGLGTEIRGLANTTRGLNQSLTDIKDEAAEHYYFADRPADVPWLKVVGAAKAVLHWIGLSPFWALSLLMLSLPRFLVEQTIWILFWIFSVLISYAKKVILGHRTGSNCDDTEKVAGDRANFLMRRSPRTYRTHPYYQTRGKVQPQELCVPDSQLSLLPCTNADSTERNDFADKGLTKVLEEWATLRSRIRVSSGSRLPSRLYAGSEPTGRTFPRTRAQL